MSSLTADEWEKILLKHPPPVVWRLMYYAAAMDASERFEPSVAPAGWMMEMARLYRGELPKLAKDYDDHPERYYGKIALLLANVAVDPTVLQKRLVDFLFLYRSELAEADGEALKEVN